MAQRSRLRKHSSELNSMTRRVNNILKAAGKAFVVMGAAGALILICGYLRICREHGVWAKAFVSIKTGTLVEQADTSLAALSPCVSRRAEIRPGDQQQYAAPSNATTHRHDRAPHRGQCRFFPDADGKVVDKQKWWD
jgi:hypothetical protein